MKRLAKKTEAELERLTDAVNEAAVAYNAARAEFESFREDVHGQLSDYFDDRSERWQESEAGDAYGTFRDAWEEESTDGEAGEVDDDAYPTEAES